MDSQFAWRFGNDLQYREFLRTLFDVGFCNLMRWHDIGRCKLAMDSSTVTGLLACLDLALPLFVHANGKISLRPGFSLVFQIRLSRATQVAI